MQGKRSGTASVKRSVGAAAKPRLTVFRSNTEIYAQLIDDDNGTTIASASSRDKDIVAQKVTKQKKANWLVDAIARKATELGVNTVCIRSWWLYLSWPCKSSS